MKANQLFEKHPVSLTILSPLHIGSGEVYEPTNFVADTDKQMLYFFDPSLVPLTGAERNRLGKIARGSTVREIYKFFDEHFDLYSAYALQIVPFDKDIRQKIEKLKSGVFREGKRTNKLEIPRTMFNCRGRKVLPYVPGSTLKGAVHTAFLDRCSLSYRGPLLENRDLDRVLLKGTMDKSPMKLISISDFLMKEEAVSGTRIISRLNIKKTDQPRLGRSSVPSAAEVILPGEFRPFYAEITLRQPLKEDGVDKTVCYRSVSEIFKDLNRFSQSQFLAQSEYWARGNEHTNKWLLSVRNLLKGLAPKLEKGTAALVRIGMNTGATNFTLRRPGFAKIMSRGPQNSRFVVDDPKTLTAAIIDTGHFQGMLPFGWAILEFDPSENEVLKTWSRTASNMFPNPQREVFSELSVLRRVLDEKQKRIQEEEERLKKAAEEKDMAEAEARRKLASMPENLRKLSLIVSKIQSASRIPPGSELSKEVVSLLADADRWSPEEKGQVVSAIGKFVKSKGLDAGNVGKGIKQQLRKLKGE